MSKNNDHRRAASAPRVSGTAAQRLVVYRETGGSLVAVRRHWWDDALARARSFTLDEELAQGRPPESSRLRAVRAAQLVSPTQRAQLARFWLKDVDRARRDRTSGGRRRGVAISQAEVLGASGEIAELVGELLARRPVAARGVAMAYGLLSAASSPVYSPGGGRHALAPAVAEALRCLDPARAEYSPSEI